MPDTQSLTRRDARRQLQRLVDEQTATYSDNLYMSERDSIKQLGKVAARKNVFGEKKSQMNKLERRSTSASTYGAIADYIKSQMGRDTNTGEAWSDSGFGEQLLTGLQATISEAPSDAEALLQALDERLFRALRREDEGKEAARHRLKQDVGRRLRVGYAQALVAHVVSEYNYRVSTG